MFRPDDATYLKPQCRERAANAKVTLEIRLPRCADARNADRANGVSTKSIKLAK